jgi:hypothetical protein
MNLIPDNSAGTYWLLAGTLVTNNFNVTYEPGKLPFYRHRLMLASWKKA